MDNKPKKYQAEYDKYVEERRGYNFSSLDYYTWLSWHLNTPLPKLREKLDNGEEL